MSATPTDTPAAPATSTDEPAAKRAKTNDGAAVAVSSETATTDRDVKGKGEAINQPLPPSDESFDFERGVGIEEFLGEGGFTGLIKHRYTDFLVNEIDVNGQVVHLTSQELPPIPAEPKDSVATHEAILRNIIGEEELAKFLSFVERFEADNKLNETHVFPTIDSKENRTAVHKSVAQAWPGLDTKTQDVGGESHIVAARLKRGTRRNNTWPSSRPPYLRFVLFKENKDTHSALGIITKLVRVKQNRIAVGGTKDKRGVTTQLVTLEHVEAATLAGQTLYGMRVGNFEYVENALRLGDCLGNRFTVVVREIEEDDERVYASVESLRSTGFINYYGTQRFGTSDHVRTHEVGLAVFRQDWKAACGLILTAQSRDHGLGAARDSLGSGEKEFINKALIKTPRKMSIERDILDKLKRRPTDLCGAFQALHRPTRLMYVHAYQSYVWNRVASERVRVYGHTNAVAGDLVFVDDSDSHRDERGPRPVRVLTADEAAETSIYDIVLPLPGTGVVYPENDMAEFYKSVLAEDNVDFANHPQKEYRLEGAYRKVFVKPLDVEAEIIRYTERNKTLTYNDWNAFKNDPKPESEPEGPLKALIVSFSLPSSAYATMALRELMKTATNKKQLMKVGGKRSREE